MCVVPHDAIYGPVPVLDATNANIGSTNSLPKGRDAGVTNHSKGRIGILDFTEWDAQHFEKQLRINTPFYFALVDIWLRIS